MLQAGQSRDRIPLRTNFSTTIQTSPGAHSASYTMGTESFPGVKRPGRGVHHPPPSSDKVEGLRGLFYGEVYFTYATNRQVAVSIHDGVVEIFH